MAEPVGALPIPVLRMPRDAGRSIVASPLKAEFVGLATYLSMPARKLLMHAVQRSLGLRC